MTNKTRLTERLADMRKAVKDLRTPKDRIEEAYKEHGVNGLMVLLSDALRELDEAQRDMRTLKGKLRYLVSCAHDSKEFGRIVVAERIERLITEPKQAEDVDIDHRTDW